LKGPMGKKGRGTKRGKSDDSEAAKKSTKGPRARKGEGEEKRILGCKITLKEERSKRSSGYGKRKLLRRENY